LWRTVCRRMPELKLGPTTVEELHDRRRIVRRPKL
jgi:hypothetical protein